ncbi:hypothetical protein [Arthrobacter zhaoxinii]|uniref:hypothetical protein n=1 Tax=Arthrobacter zhaoxinii TaxID=2964616 RepID=UPI0021072409|nr:hypothetical protein [Arthrobacter zhaoxinii]MCQ1999538.1 hypothetical protein [Arthrobacter zhaoxinii]
MSLGHYHWKNDNPDQPGYGKELDIDVDALPKTDLPPNVELPNLHIDDNGYILRCMVPNFYMSPDGTLYHSTNYGG